MSASPREPLLEDGVSSFEIHELHIAPSGTQHIPVTSLQRRARDDESETRAPCIVEPRRNRGEPRLAVLVRERNTRRHTRHVFRRVVGVPFNELYAERASEEGADQALPGAAHAHDDVEPAVHDDRRTLMSADPWAIASATTCHVMALRRLWQNGGSI